MEVVYNQKKLNLYEKRFRQGLKLTETARQANDEKRKSGKTLKVVALSQGNAEYVPSIRVAGKWLRRFGFEIGNEVELIATDGQIQIKRRAR
jgi:hypothetical protein